MRCCFSVAPTGLDCCELYPNRKRVVLELIIDVPCLARFLLLLTAVLVNWADNVIARAVTTETKNILTEWKQDALSISKLKEHVTISHSKK